MNKYEKSISMLKDWNDKEHIFTKNVITDLEELVERATPKKVIMNKDGFGGKCPNCKRMVLHNYCEDCGQALEWE